ncbi:hypothetical protein GYO_1235 [Bacillus spizizenii TU-B-10]|uniref:Uncharacterized protein n=1 Tax=Bacillus spizizenii (strain DSM 15029 / JCM 12233 / NBRC 101239 / NRRL B-23049 / TU-B-10) TaxID=1052585 RepID=G4NUP4_BACS4|nr:hypothetical protein GYO_1235 [Bacillus spizizenii TU-B-10]
MTKPIFEAHWTGFCSDNKRHFLSSLYYLLFLSSFLYIHDQEYKRERPESPLSFIERLLI